MTSRGTPAEIQQKAQARLAVAEVRRRDAEKSLAEDKAKSNAVAAKTIRLRALRLAKEAADAAETRAALEQRIRDGGTAPASPKPRVKKSTKANPKV